MAWKTLHLLKGLAPVCILHLWVPRLPAFPLFVDVVEFEDKRLFWCIDKVINSLHFVVGSPLNCEVLQKFGDSNLNLKLSKTLPNAHPWSMAEIPDWEWMNVFLVLNPALRDKFFWFWELLGVFSHQLCEPENQCTCVKKSALWHWCEIQKSENDFSISAFPSSLHEPGLFISIPNVPLQTSLLTAKPIVTHAYLAL